MPSTRSGQLTPGRAWDCYSSNVKSHRKSFCFVLKLGFDVYGLNVQHFLKLQSMKDSVRSFIEDGPFLSTKELRAPNGKLY